MLAGWTPGGGSSLAQHVTEDLALDVANDGWVVTGDVHLHNSHGFETRLLANPLTRWANIIGTNWSCYFLGNINGGWAVLQYMSCWDWVGMKFKMVGMDPNRCHLKPRPATLIRKHPEWMVWLHLVEQHNHGQMEFTNY